MTRIVYKKLLNKYLIDSISEHSGDGITLELSEPIDAKIVIGENVYNVSHGVCNIKEPLFYDEETLPKLYTGAHLHELEGFVYKGHTAHRTGNRDEIIKDALLVIERLSNRLDAAESDISELKEKVSRKLNLI